MNIAPRDDRCRRRDGRPGAPRRPSLGWDDVRVGRGGRRRDRERRMRAFSKVFVSGTEREKGERRQLVRLPSGSGVGATRRAAGGRRTLTEAKKGCFENILHAFYCRLVHLISSAVQLAVY